MKNRTILTALAALSLFVASYVGAELVTDSTPVPPAGTLGGPTVALTGPALEQWIRGRRVFDRDWDHAQGLGSPDLNGDSCRACHQTPVIGGSGLLDVNVFRFANDNGGAGPYTDLPGGQIASKSRTPHTPGREEVNLAADLFEVRQTPIMFGIGLIDTIADATILGNEDPADLDGDGCRGIARLIDVGNPTFEVGKFGWKAQIPKVTDFTRDALGEEIGITVPDDGRGIGKLTDLDVIPDPEVVDADVDDLNFFLLNLAPPPRAGGTDPAIAIGEGLFTSIGCAVCHIPTLPGSGGPVPLFSDLLLHDIHPANFRGMSEPGAGVGMYRTPPLWGLRDSGPYLHDGSATTIEDAILSHDDEALNMRLEYEGLTVEQQDALLIFLLDL